MLPELPADLLERITRGQRLPSPLPVSPFPIIQQWLKEAREANATPNPNAMALATREEGGRVAVRTVLCRGFSEEEGFVAFFTNYTSRKARAAEWAGEVCINFHLDHQERQAQVEGPVTRSPGAESDAYWASRPWESRLSAWASEQSQPVASREVLVARLPRIMADLGITAEQIREQGNSIYIPRPAHWGGYRVWGRRVECWVGGPGRLHDRASWERSLNAAERGDGVRVFEGSGWSSTRLHP